ncbi:hypothetical protein LUD75_02440 [Epilithonimonas sp. JDS]|uniref:hypothetical protein n=1 Tax=Epilithonimonas sp. JDS TaxID=2902797 RepID=UPI001E4D6884|nr:hypothetical protein [Epilithonimonas sp. JDS]MCD9853549.1 hypothetical protein [Epilithonimonas sp. JDS]
MKINAFLLSLILIGCNKVDPNQAIISKTKTELPSEKADSEEKTIMNLNKEIVELLKNKDYAKLSKYIHSEKGIHFSMYSFVSDKDKSFSKTDFENYVDSDEKFTFGHKDGSGAIYIVSIKDYLEDWVFKKDFSKSKINYNNFEGKGNSLNNVKEKYPDAVTVENYLAGTVEYSYMDWNSLILVFEKVDNQYYLVSICNNQWTV